MRQTGTATIDTSALDTQVEHEMQTHELPAFRTLWCGLCRPTLKHTAPAGTLSRRRVSS